MQCVGSWCLSDTAHHGRGLKRRKADQQAQWPVKLQLNQRTAQAVAPTQKRKFKTKSVHIMRDEEEVGLSKQEEEAGTEIII